jgi:hypothetical protein
LLKSDPASASQPATIIKLAETTPSTPANSTTTATLSSTDGGGAAPAGNDDDWSVEQQKQLEKALKETAPADPERWEKIAAIVEGKTKKQCIRRYKRLAEMVKQSKTVTGTTT